MQYNLYQPLHVAQEESHLSPIKIKALYYNCAQNTQEPILFSLEERHEELKFYDVLLELLLLCSTPISYLLPCGR